MGKIKGKSTKISPGVIFWTFGCLSLLFCVRPSVSAQGPSPEGIAQKVQAAYEKTADLQMDFTQMTYVALLEEEVQKSGVAQFKKPGKFRISYREKRSRTYLSDGKTLWIFREGDPQVREIPVNDENVPAEALSFLGGFAKLEKDFAVEPVDPKKVKELKIGAENFHWLELTPLKKQSQINWMVAGFDPHDFLIRRLYLFTDTGNLSQYRFTNLKTNEGLPESVFTYKVGAQP